MREWTERHILELIRKIWDQLKNDLNKAGSELSGKFKLNLRTQILTKMEIPIAGIGYLMPHLEVMPFPYEIKDYLEGHGFAYTQRGYVTIVKLTIPNRYQWMQSVKENAAEFVVYQPSMGLSAGWQVVEDDKNPLVKWILNVLTGQRGIATLGNINISGPIAFYSYDPIKRELYGERIINQKSHISDSFHGYNIQSVFGANILSWKFPSEPESNEVYAFLNSPVPVHEIPKDWLHRAISHFDSLDTLNDTFNYINTTLEIGDIHEIIE